jgi:hypothetical protein
MAITIITKKKTADADVIEMSIIMTPTMMTDLMITTDEAETKAHTIKKIIWVFNS